jgi:hypothetical protein
LGRIWGESPFERAITIDATNVIAKDRLPTVIGPDLRLVAVTGGNLDGRRRHEIEGEDSAVKHGPTAACTDG